MQSFFKIQNKEIIDYNNIHNHLTNDLKLMYQIHLLYKYLNYIYHILLIKELEYHQIIQLKQPYIKKFEKLYHKK